MNEFIKKLIDMLESKIEITWKHDYQGGRKDAFNEAIEIVNQLQRNITMNRSRLMLIISTI